MTTTAVVEVDSPFDEDLAPRKWQFLANCLGHEDKDAFFSEKPSEVRKAKMICSECPVKLLCLRDNLSEPFGVFGGLTPRERKRMMREQA